MTILVISTPSGELRINAVGHLSLSLLPSASPSLLQAARVIVRCLESTNSLAHSDGRARVRVPVGTSTSFGVSASLRYLDPKIREVPDGGSSVTAVVFFLRCRPICSTIKRSSDAKLSYHRLELVRLIEGEYTWHTPSTSILPRPKLTHNMRRPNRVWKRWSGSQEEHFSWVLTNTIRKKPRPIT